jgi:hypothetical protein
MISITKCTKILNQIEKKYTTEEIKKIRVILTKLAMNEFELYMKKP